MEDQVKNDRYIKQIKKKSEFINFNRTFKNRLIYVNTFK